MKYYVEPHEDVDDARPFNKAESYHDHNDITAMDAGEEFEQDSGGEMADPSSWPVTVVLLSKDGKVSKWRVKMEYSPDFYAEEVE